MKKIKFILISAVLLLPVFQAKAEVVGHDIKNYDKFEPEFYGDGVRYRSFLIKPQISTDIKYNDNIYAKNTNKVSDTIFVARPIFDARSDWRRHELNVRFAAETGNYFNEEDENYSDYNFSTSGKLDIKNSLHLTGALDYYKSHEERGSPDDQNSIKPNIYSELVGRAGIIKDKTRITARLLSEFRMLDYDNSFNRLGGIINNDDRDRKQYGLNGRIGYELNPGLNTFINTSVNKIAYDNAAISRLRDSKGFSVSTGAEIALTGKLLGEAYIGYLTQDYENSAFEPTSGVDFGASLLWQATNLTSVKAELLRSVNETVLTGASGYLQTSSAITVDHELLRNVILRAKGEYRNDQYEGINRDDDVYGISLAGKYFINRKISLRTQYNYEERTSSQPGNEYNTNTILAGITLSM